MNNVVPVAAAGTAAVLVNRWVQKREIPLLGTAAGLSNRVVGTTLGSGLRVLAVATEGVGAVVVGAGLVTRRLATVVEGVTAPPQDTED